MALLQHYYINGIYNNVQTFGVKKLTPLFSKDWLIWLKVRENTFTLSQTSYISNKCCCFKRYSSQSSHRLCLFWWNHKVKCTQTYTTDKHNWFKKKTLYECGLEPRISVTLGKLNTMYYFNRLLDMLLYIGVHLIYDLALY